MELCVARQFEVSHNKLCLLTTSKRSTNKGTGNSAPEV